MSSKRKSCGADEAGGAGGADESINTKKKKMTKVRFIIEAVHIPEVHIPEVHIPVDRNVRPSCPVISPIEGIDNLVEFFNCVSFTNSQRRNSI